MTDEFRFCPTCGTDTSSSGSDAPTEVMPDSTLLLLLRRVVGDRYEIHHLLGRGGMGAVFKATDIKLQRTVAIKVLPPEYATEQRVRDRFLREAQSAAHLDHPNVVSIYVVEDDPELHYFIMKFVEGKPLDQILERGKLPWQEVQHIVFEAAQGLAHAHRRGVVHRDVKPANIVLDAEGHALLADFGISKVQSANTTFTPTGAIVGTPAYLSPEQAKTEEADGRSDQYSLGMVAYRMLAGKPAFAGDSAHTLIYKHIFADVPPLQDECPETPEFLVAAIHRALSKSPGEDNLPQTEPRQGHGDGLRCRAHPCPGSPFCRWGWITPPARAAACVSLPSFHWLASRLLAHQFCRHGHEPCPRSDPSSALHREH